MEGVLALYGRGVRRDTTIEGAGLLDVMPTLLDAAGVDIPESVTGRSVLPLLREVLRDHDEH